MFPSEIPTEVVECFLQYIDGNSKKATALACRRVARTWSHVSLQFVFANLIFKNWDDIVCFLALRSASTPSTFPVLIKSERVVLNKLTVIDNAFTSALKGLMAAIALPESLVIHVTTGSIGDILAVVNQSWADISQVTLCGGIHPPASFFAQLASFPQLRSMTLQDFQLERVENGDEDKPPTQFSFPASLVKLSLDRSSTLWPFFKTHILPGAGFANVDELYIRSQFSFEEEGVWEMTECLREIQGVRVLKLDAVYDVENPHLTRDMKNILHGGPCRRSGRLALAKIHGLSLLQLRLADIPADVSLDCIGMYSLYLPEANAGISVEVEVPRSIHFWADSDPSAHVRGILDVPQLDPGDAAIGARASLTVKGFPGTLPAEVKALGRAMVCGYPVAFMESEGEEAGM